MQMQLQVVDMEFTIPVTDNANHLFHKVFTRQSLSFSNTHLMQVSFLSIRR